MIQPTANMTFEATIHLSEAEIRILNRIASYDARRVATKLEDMCDFDAQVLISLLRRLQPETGSCIRRFDAARKAFEAKPEPLPVPG